MVVLCPHDVVIEPEHRDPVADVLPVAPLLEAREEVVEVLQPVLQHLIHPLHEVLPPDAVRVMLQPQPPARLGVPEALVRPYGPATVPPPDLLEEEVGVQDGLVVRDAEPEEGPQSGLVGDPDPGLPPLDANHRLVHEDVADEPPVHVEPVAYGSQPLDPLPDRLVAPLHQGLKNP